MGQNFIRCTDAETIQKLKSLGFQLYEENNSYAIFLNNSSLPETFDDKKIAYTNILPMTKS